MEIYKDYIKKHEEETNINIKKTEKKEEKKENE